MKQAALELVGRILSSKVRQAAEIAGFSPTNADPVIRPRGRRRARPKIHYAAIAALYADPRRPTKKALGQDLNYQESTIKSWLTEARRLGFLSPSGREITDAARGALDKDGRDPAAILTAI